MPPGVLQESSRGLQEPPKKALRRLQEALKRLPRDIQRQSKTFGAKNPSSQFSACTSHFAYSAATTVHTPQTVLNKKTRIRRQSKTSVQKFQSPGHSSQGTLRILYENIKKDIILVDSGYFTLRHRHSTTAADFGPAIDGSQFTVRSSRFAYCTVLKQKNPC